MAEKKKKTRYEIKRTVGGKVRHFYGSSPREANQKYLDAVKQEEHRQEESALFENVAWEWWVHYQKKVKHGTIRAYKSGYDRAMEFFSGYRMKEITPGLVNTWVLSYSQRGAAASTARNAKSCLNLIFKYWCVRDGQAYNPVEYIDIPRGMKKEDREPPTQEQVQTVRQHPEGFGLCAWLFMYTGCRLGEVIALQWGDIDFENGIIHITKSATWVNCDPVIETPKTKNSVRIVPLLNPLRRLLEPLRGGSEEYVLGGNEPLKSYQYRKLWLSYCKEHGMVEVDEKAEIARDRKYKKAYDRERVRKPPKTHLYKVAVTAHQFRHEFASMMYEAEIGEMEAQKILGHADIATTRKIYTHIRDRQIANAAAQMNRFLEKSDGKSV